MPALARPSSARKRRLGVPWGWTFVALVGLVYAMPVVMLARATQRARECVAAYEQPRGLDLPDCAAVVERFVFPAKVPWTSVPARYRAEELGARVAIAAYVDRGIGRPDGVGLVGAAPGIIAADKKVKEGSQRVVLEELGRAVGAPHLGRLAMLTGDRRTLVDHNDLWDDWAVRVRALESALLEADLERAGEVAKGYAAWDPRDEDLRVAVGLTLCLGADPKRGMELLGPVQKDRAKQRHESWTRNWGEVRLWLVACAERAAVVPPPLPDPGDGGVGDHAGARAALRFRVLRRAGIQPEDSMLKDTATSAIQLLEQPLPAGRVMVLAALLNSGFPLEAPLVASLARPRAADEEPVLVDPDVAPYALEWLDLGRGARPWLPPSWLRTAAGRLRDYATSKEEMSAEEREALVIAAAATSLTAARLLANAGEADRALEAIAEAGDRALPSALARALARASALRVAGAPERALAELDPEPDAAATPATRATRLLERAEVLASLGRRDEAAREAVAADAAAASAGSRPLEVRARWARLALAHSLREPARPAPGGQWPWVGVVASADAWLPPEAEGVASEAALAFFSAAIAAAPEERRAIRYAAVNRHRGDASIARLPYLALGAELLAPGEGDRETWLDAFSVTDSRKISLRGYAWLRAEAARWRGDAESAARWSARYTTLSKLAADPSTADAARGLGI